MMRHNIDPKGSTVTASTQVTQVMDKETIIESRIQFFQQIADPVRHSILDLLLKENEISVTDILIKLKKPQTLVSYHLRCLKELGLVIGKKADDDGRKTLYSLHSPKSVQTLFSMAETYTQAHKNCGNEPCTSG